MKRALTILLFSFVMAGGVVPYCFSQTVSSQELINNAKMYDNKTVVFEGEVIGDVMRRKDFAWVNIYDGQNAIGVWMPASLARDIIFTGSHKSKGDVVEVTGIFHRACPEHGADLDIHAQAMRKIAPGKPLTETLNTGKRDIFFVLMGVLCLILIFRLLKMK